MWHTLAFLFGLAGLSTSSAAQPVAVTVFDATGGQNAHPIARWTLRVPAAGLARVEQGTRENAVDGAARLVGALPTDREESIARRSAYVLTGAVIGVVAGAGAAALRVGRLDQDEQLWSGPLIVASGIVGGVIGGAGGWLVFEVRRSRADRRDHVQAR